MSQKEDYKYFEANKKLWNKKVGIHIESDFYANESFKKHGNSLMHIERKVLQNLKGKRLLHLQCHFGQDSISLAKMGAKVTAIDISDEAIKQARILAKEMRVGVNFIESNVLNICEILDEKFDIIYTSYGTICWIPELDQWAENIKKLLATDGLFYMVDFHPYLYTIDWPSLKPSYNYFNKHVYHEINEGTYADNESKIRQDEYFWIHPMADIISSMLKQNLTLRKFAEYDYSPYDCFENTSKRQEQEYVLNIDISIPHIYELLFENQQKYKSK